MYLSADFVLEDYVFFRDFYFLNLDIDGPRLINNIIIIIINFCF